MKIIAIDVGGTEVKGRAFDPNPSEYVVRPTDITGGKATILATVLDVIKALYTPDVKAIGLVTAGAVDPIKKRIVHNTGTLPGWIDFNLEAAIRQHYDVPVFVENDANGAMMAEMGPLLGEGVDHAVMLTLGTGVGTAVYLDGQCVRGSRFQIEFGHMILYPNGRRCTCGKQGCLEQYVSGSALLRRAGEQFGHPIEHASVLFDALDQGNRQAHDVWRAYLDDLALVLYNIQRFYDPERIILGGGVMREGARLLNDLKPSLKAYEPLAMIVKATYGAEAGIKGAYDIALKGLTAHG